jgi:KaiC/GvpD/RAD55 family RecA-like ATPase
MNVAPDREQIRRAIQVLHAPNAVIELRALHKGRKVTSAGYFDHEHRDQLIEEAMRLNAEGAAVYVVMNPLDPQLLARHANRVQSFAQATATDNNVTRRYWLLIDIDPQRPKDTSATAEQLEATTDRARKVYGYLAEQQWPRPVVAHSGNGVHLLYRIDLPNDDPSRDLIKRCLEALAGRFDDAAVKIDRSVFNAARIVKLHGTIANKGDDVPAAPWRLSQLKSVPEQIETVSVSLLQGLAAEVAPAEKPKGYDRTHDAHAWTDADVSAFLARGGIEAIGEPSLHEGALRWRLRRCPFNSEHVNGEAAVFQLQSGALVFKCMHNGCADKRWNDLRELIDGPRESRRSTAPTASRAQRPTEAPVTPDTEATVMTLSTVPYQPLRPLWPGKLWRGKLALMAGDPGLGKSLSTLDIAARITRGSPWPASTDRAPPGDVVLLSAEDDAADTLRPRLESAGADLDRVHTIIEVMEVDPQTGKRRRKSFRLGAHLDQLEQIFERFKPLLLIVDPITAYMSADTDSHATADVRSDLAPLADLAQRHGVAVLMVSHLNKATTMQALYRVTGSVAFVAAARSAFGVVRDPNDRDRRYFLPLKNNLGKDTGGLAYRIAFDGRAPHVTWETDPVDVDIDEVTAGISPRERAKRAGEDAAGVWLRDQLANGAVAASDIWRRAKESGHSERKLKAAIRQLGIEKAPAGYRGAWHYSLPSESCTFTGSQNASNSVRLCEFPEDSPQSDSARVSDSTNFSGISQSRTESDGFCEPGKVHESVPGAAESEAFW